MIAIPKSKDSITIPDSVTKIEEGAFWGCSSLKTIYLKHQNPVDFSRAFKAIDRFNVTIYVPEVQAGLIGIINSIKQSKR